MAELLDDAWAKLDRAGEHIQALKAEIRRFGESRPYTVTGDPDLHSGEYVLRIKPKEPPKRISILIGDVLSNLRPSLDYLIAALAILDSGKARKSNQFPICDTPELFKGELAKGRLTGVSADHSALIEKLQPYPRRKGKVWLRLLREYSNPDKHRHLNVLLSHIEGDFNLPAPETVQQQTFILGPTTNTGVNITSGAPENLFNVPEAWSYPSGGAIALNTGVIASPSSYYGGATVVPSLSFSTSVAEAQQSPAERNVHVELSVSVGVAFPEGTPVVETLQIFESQIAKTLNAFEREF